MQKIINQLGTAQYNPIRKVVEVKFKNLGDMPAYQETLNLALYISTTLNVNKWLFIKESFNDISPSEFLQAVKSWFFKNKSILQGGKIFLLTRVLEKQQILNMNKIYHLPINIFSSENLAYRHLEEKPLVLE